MNQHKLIEILYPYVPGPALAEYLGLSDRQLYNKTYRNGIKKNAVVKKTMNRNLVLRSGNSSRFKKGHIPFNKGKKCPNLLLTNAASTMFKPGRKPHNTREDNATTIRTDSSGRKYCYSKLADSKWVLTHRLIWEQVNGPIPPKHMVRFIDGNTMNLDISNLECIPMSENAVRNTIHRFPDELKSLIKLKSKLNKKIKNKQNGKK